MSIGPNPFELIYDEVYGEMFALTRRADIDKFIRAIGGRFLKDGKLHFLSLLD
jgi:hypothetical protein